MSMVICEYGGANKQICPCSSCAVASIGSLSSHKDAEDAMEYFCTQMLGNPVGVPSSGFKSKSTPMFKKVVSHWVFCAGPEEKGGPYGYWTNYGTSFAKFITDNKLGGIATLPPTYNLKWHASTKCQVWMWQPDQKALEKWWADRLKKIEEAKEGREDS